VTTIISTLFITLDGVAEIDVDWHLPYFDDAMGECVGADYQGIDVLLLGRITYESFAGAWPVRESEGGEDAEFAAQLGDTRKVVITSGEHDLGWRNVERSTDPVSAARALREEGVGKVLVAGSLPVVRALIDGGELDELHLLVHPIAARNGERLFDESGPMVPLTLLRSRALPSGVLALEYGLARGAGS
jgi:dihydrofolate reductase